MSLFSSSLLISLAGNFFTNYISGQIRTMLNNNDLKNILALFFVVKIIILWRWRAQIAQKSKNGEEGEVQRVVRRERGLVEIIGNLVNTGILWKSVNEEMKWVVESLKKS